MFQNAEIKWKLEEKLSEVPKPITNPVVDDKNKTASDQPIRMVETCDAETSQVKPNEIPASTVNFRERSKEDEIKEATRIATGFVAAIMASAVAEFIATECENNHNYKEVLSAAQVHCCCFVLFVVVVKDIIIFLFFFIYLFIYLFIYFFIYLFVYLFILFIYYYYYYYYYYY